MEAIHVHVFPYAPLLFWVVYMYYKNLSYMFICWVFLKPSSKVFHLHRFQLQSRVIDDKVGRVFEVDIADLNNDGRPDLLVTTNGANGTLLAYEIPDDFR